MTVLNNLDRFHLVLDVIERVGVVGEEAQQLKERLEMKLIEHRDYIRVHGVDMPEVRNWKWNN